MIPRRSLAGTRGPRRTGIPYNDGPMTAPLYATGRAKAQIPGQPVVPPIQALPLWLRLLSRLPLGLLYGLTGLLSFTVHRVAGYRTKVVRSQIARCFPQLPRADQRRMAGDYYRNLAQLVAELLKSATISAEELQQRVSLVNPEVLTDPLDAGQSVLVVAAHHCNWEWLLLALSLRLRQPLTGAYKPLHDPYTERLMRNLRGRFGGNLVPAKELLTNILKDRGTRAIAMVADQEPVTSDYKHWTTFLDSPTAFYMGPEKIAQVTRFPVVFAGMQRTARGHYEVRFELLAAARERLAPGSVTERYARAVEQLVRAAPANWTWSHRRWKLKPEAAGATHA